MVDVKALMQAAKNTTAPSCEERMALYNSRRGDLTGYDCPICRNKGFVFLMKGGLVLYRRTGRGRENAHLHRYCESTHAAGQGRALHDLDGRSHQAKSPQDG